MPKSASLSLRRRLAQQRPVGVFWMSTGSATVIELAVHAKPDAVVIDAQHGVWDRQTIEYAVGAVGQHAPVLIRTAENSPVAIGQALDAGAEGVIVPLIETEHEAAAAVTAARFPPDGARSAGGVRALGRDFASYLAEAKQRTIVGVMIETGRAVQNAGAIAKTTGIDFVFIGTGDLALSLGAGPTSDSRLEQACRTVFVACKAAKIPCATFTGTVEAAIKRRQEGYALVVVASDIDVLANGFSTAMERFNDAGSRK
jgi:2-keto-3-deoxy-L-rhamnonate aldolase RhmA